MYLILRHWKNMSTKFTLAAPLLVAAALLGVALDAAAEQPLSVFSRAIGEGQATGQIGGTMATRWQEMTRSSEPVTITAKVLKRFKQEGCARLEVEMGQEKVPLKDGGFAPFSTKWALNVCVDGMPPKDLTEKPDAAGPRVGARK